MLMTNEEIIRRYKAAGDDKRKMIRILAELNACPKENIRQILREAGCEVPATGNRYTAQAKAAKAMMTASEEAEAEGNKRKQTKAEARTAESPYGLLPDADETQIGRCPEQKVGTTSEDPGKRMFGDILETKKAAPTACQPAQPVDVWGGVIALGEYDEDTIRFAEEELRRLNELIEAMGQDVRRRRLEIRADKCKAEYLRLWLRNVNGGTEG